MIEPGADSKNGSGRSTGRPELATQVAVWGDVPECLEALGGVTAAGARLLLLNPVFDEAEQLERIAAEIAPRL